MTSYQSSIDSSDHIYGGPRPCEINPNWADHTFEEITCLLNGERKKRIDRRYLASLGYDIDRYRVEFFDAPLVSEATRLKYAEKTEARLSARRNTLGELNRSDEFQLRRAAGNAAFWNSEVSDALRKQLRAKAIKQHEDGLLQHIRETYWKKPYSKKRKIFEQTDLHYMSSNELKFLKRCKKNGVDLVAMEDGPVFTGEKLMYWSEYKLGNAIIEIKSQFIEDVQESRRPGITEAKRILVETQGYRFIYIKDEDYDEFDNFYASFVEITPVN